MRLDERDTMFSRMALSKGTKNYEDYYSRNPEKKNLDDLLRSLPGPGSKESPTFDPLGSPVTDSLFRFLADIRPLSEGDPSSPPRVSDPAMLTMWARGLAVFLGADDVGVAAMKPGYWYTHRGRLENSYGAPVNADHPFALAIISAMDPDMIHKGPLVPVMAESARGYLRSGVTAIAAAYAIREMGYNARAHTDGNYLLVAPLVAAEAGLGVFGRSGLLIHRRFGPCARISVVTTDMPLIPDERDAAAGAVREFCAICGRCSRSCPGRAISEGFPDESRGDRWLLNAEKCYGAWSRMGTDCGVCISACPFTGGMDWDELVRAQGNPEALDAILRGCGGKSSPRPFDPEPPDWWKQGIR